MEARPIDGAGVCCACLGLHCLPHSFSDCPLLRAALHTCECSHSSNINVDHDNNSDSSTSSCCPLLQPRCFRRLFVILAALQLSDALITHPELLSSSSASSSSSSSSFSVSDIDVASLVARAGLTRLWGPLVPLEAFSLHLVLHQQPPHHDARVYAPRALPTPRRWNTPTPFAMEMDLWALESNGYVEELEKPLPVLCPVKCAVVALDWTAFLLDVLSAVPKIVSKGQLMPTEFRQQQLVLLPGANQTYSSWVPLLMHPTRGFLMGKGERRRWKSFQQLTPQKILQLESQMKAR